jgi:hypothetical protein
MSRHDHLGLPPHTGIPGEGFRRLAVIAGVTATTFIVLVSGSLAGEVDRRASLIANCLGSAIVVFLAALGLIVPADKPEGFFASIVQMVRGFVVWAAATIPRTIIALICALSISIFCWDAGEGSVHVFPIECTAKEQIGFTSWKWGELDYRACPDQGEPLRLWQPLLGYEAARAGLWSKTGPLRVEGPALRTAPLPPQTSDFNARLLGRWEGRVTYLPNHSVTNSSMMISLTDTSGNSLRVDLLSDGDRDYSPTWNATSNGTVLQYLQGNKNKCENQVRLSLSADGDLVGNSSPADDTQSIDVGCGHKTYNQPDNYSYRFHKLD